MSKQTNPGVVDELRRVRVPDGTHWGVHFDPKADGGRGVVRLRGWAAGQPQNSGTPRVDIRMSPLVAVGFHRLLARGGGLDEVRVGPPSVMPRLNGPRRVTVGPDVEVRWAAGFDGDRLRFDAIDSDTGSVELALELSETQARIFEPMLRVKLGAAGGPEFSGMPR